ncbi:hypothetical protein [Rhodanobacter sp. T12-5]|uniref:hypothetical protein n=1 Tax=Rhodanobacter sp. T12-5 TaxID=2024611 RepID=UPI0011ED73F9|nr:hypothetical protein [Rhodanobacter sp. T12-5]
MDTKTNVPACLRLDEEDVFYLSVALAWYEAFPSALRKHTRLHFDRLHYSIRSGEISAYGLLSAAYIGFAPLPTSYRRFITHANRINKLEPHAQSAAFRKSAVAREHSAAGEFGFHRNELKRLLARVNELAEHFIGIANYEKTFNCKDLILKDPSPFAPPDSETFAEGPLYLWDLAKAVNEHQLAGMHFGTFNGWVLFVHLEDGVVAGHAIHPVALRNGDMFDNPFGDEILYRMAMGYPTDCIGVPDQVSMAVEELANRRFPGNSIRLVPPPMIHAGLATPSRSGQTVLRRQSTKD